MLSGYVVQRKVLVYAYKNRFPEFFRVNPKFVHGPIFSRITLIRSNKVHVLSITLACYIHCRIFYILKWFKNWSKLMKMLLHKLLLYNLLKKGDHMLYNPNLLQQELGLYSIWSPFFNNKRVIQHIFTLLQQELGLYSIWSPFFNKGGVIQHMVTLLQKRVRVIQRMVSSSTRVRAIQHMVSYSTRAGSWRQFIIATIISTVYNSNGL